LYFLCDLTIYIDAEAISLVLIPRHCRVLLEVLTCGIYTAFFVTRIYAEVRLIHQTCFPEVVPGIRGRSCIGYFLDGTVFKRLTDRANASIEAGTILLVFVCRITGHSIRRCS